MLGVSRLTIYKCIDKALAAGVAAGLRDRYHRPHAPEITEAAKAWVVDLACRKPRDLVLQQSCGRCLCWPITSLWPRC